MDSLPSLTDSWHFHPKEKTQGGTLVNTKVQAMNRYGHVVLAALKSLLMFITIL